METYAVFKSPIGSIDIETLGLASSSVVFQVGMMVTNWIRLDAHPLQGEEPPFTSSLIRLGSDWKPIRTTLNVSMDISEQVLRLNRTTDQDTLNWWRSQDEDFLENLEASLSKYDVFSLQHRFDALFNKEGAEKPEYVYVNHPEFDLRILDSLLKKHDFIKGHKRIVNVGQINSMVKALRRIESGVPEIVWKKHDALEDSAWNLWIVGQAANITRQRNLPPEVIVAPEFTIVDGF